MDLKLDMLKMANLMINCYFFKFLSQKFMFGVGKSCSGVEFSSEPTPQQLWGCVLNPRMFGGLQACPWFDFTKNESESVMPIMLIFAYIGKGNARLGAEFNFACDPVAAQIVLEDTKCHCQICGWELCGLKHAFSWVIIRIKKSVYAPSGFTDFFSA